MAASWRWTPDSKLCFVTTGATAPFTQLIAAALSPKSLDALLAAGYTHLLVQYGSASDVFASALSTATAYLRERGAELVVDGMDFNADGLGAQFRLVQASKGLVVSHAGSGSILEALRYQVPIVVVPNTSLLDNHQEELAVAMERSNYVLRGHVENLAPAIQKSDEFRRKMAQFPPVTSGRHRETKSFGAIMDETMGFMD